MHEAYSKIIKTIAILILIILAFIVLAVFISKYNLNLSPQRGYRISCGSSQQETIEEDISGYGRGDTEEKAKEACRKVAFIGPSLFLGCILNRCPYQNACQERISDFRGGEETYNCHFNEEERKWECTCKIKGPVTATISCTPCVPAD